MFRNSTGWHRAFGWMILCVLVLFVSGCSALAPQPTVTPTPTETPLPTETPTLTPTATLTFTPPPTATDTPVPTDTLVPTIPPSPTVTQEPTKIPFNESVWIYYIEMIDEKNCEGKPVAISINIPRTGDVVTDVSNALRALLGYHGQWWGELYNPLAPAVLTVENVEFNPGSGNLTVAMSGAYQSSRNSCDNRLARDQFWSTVRQFKEVKGTDITLNGGSFGDRLAP